MHQGQTLKHVRGEGSPLKHSTFAAVCSALASGLKFSSNDPLLDMLRPGENNPLGVQRSFVWSFDGDATCTFEPAFHKEQIDFNEFVKRFTSDEWIKANPHHPISYMRCAFDLRADLVEQVKARPRMEVIEREANGRKSMCFIPENASPEERAKIISEFGQS